MFDYILPGLKEKGVTKFVLEVLQDNEPAIKAYQKSGFSIVRQFDCFELQFEKAQFNKEAKLSLEIKSIDKAMLSSFTEHLDWQPSWENSFTSITRIPDDVYLFGAFHKGEAVGLLVYYQALNWIMSIVVKKPYRRYGVATTLVQHLVNHLQTKVAATRILNIQHTDAGMIAFLNSVGFKLILGQYEMESYI